MIIHLWSFDRDHLPFLWLLYSEELPPTMGNANQPEQNSTRNYNVKTMLCFIATRFPLNQVTDASKCNLIELIKQREHMFPYSQQCWETKMSALKKTEFEFVLWTRAIASLACVAAFESNMGSRKHFSSACYASYCFLALANGLST